MATRFSHTATIRTRPEAVHTAYTDEAYWADRLRAIGGPQDSLDAFELHGDGVSVTVTQVIPDEDIPDLARKVLPGQLSITRNTSYSAFDGERFTGTARAEAVGGLGVIDGGGETGPEGDATVESVSGLVTVSVPLLGGKLEKMVLDHLNKLFTQEYEHLNHWTTR